MDRTIPEHEHTLNMYFLSDAYDNTPNALKARCSGCKQEWVFDATVTDLLEAESALAAANAKLDAAMKALERIESKGRTTVMTHKLLTDEKPLGFLMVSHELDEECPICTLEALRQPVEGAQREG